MLTNLNLLASDSDAAFSIGPFDLFSGERAGNAMVGNERDYDATEWSWGTQGGAERWDALFKSFIYWLSQFGAEAVDSACNISDFRGGYNDCWFT